MALNAYNTRHVHRRGRSISPLAYHLSGISGGRALDRGVQQFALGTVTGLWQLPRREEGVVVLVIEVTKETAVVKHSHSQGIQSDLGRVRAGRKPRVARPLAREGTLASPRAHYIFYWKGKTRKGRLARHQRIEMERFTKCSVFHPYMSQPAASSLRVKSFQLQCSNARWRLAYCRSKRAGLTSGVRKQSSPPLVLFEFLVSPAKDAS